MSNANEAAGRTSLQRYGWLARSRTLLIDAYWPPLNPALEFDADELAAAVRELNADAVRFGTAGKYALVPSDVYPQHPQLSGRDLLAETLKALAPLGARTIAYVPVSHGLPRSLLTDQRPGWALRLDDGSLAPGVQHMGGEQLCPTCPMGDYRDDILGFIRQIVGGHDVAGLYLDGPYYDWNMGGPLDICQCGACRSRFDRETRRELLTNAGYAAMSSDERQAFLSVFRPWVGRALLELLGEINRIAKSRDLPLMFNVFAATPRPAELERAMIAEADGFLLESDLGGLKGIAVSRHHGKIAWRYTQPHGPWPRLSTPAREAENARCGYQTLLWGGAPIVSYAGRYQYGRRFAAPVAEMFVRAERVGEVLAEAQPWGHVGIVDMHRLADADAVRRDALAGSYLSLQQAGVPATVLPREALADAARTQCAALLVPSLCDVTADEVAVLRRYVEAGRALLVCGPLPTDQAGAQLAALLGVGAAHGEAGDRLSRLQFWSGAWDVYARQSDNLLPIVSPVLTRAAADADVTAELLGGDAAEPLGPAVVVRSSGRGQCGHIAFDLGGSFWQTDEPALAEMLSATVARLAEPSPVHIESDGVAFSVWQTPTGAAVQLHNPSSRPAVARIHLTAQPGQTRPVAREIATGGKIRCDNTETGWQLRVAVERFACVAIDDWRPPQPCAD
jgi:hypothetical protein